MHEIVDDLFLVEKGLRNYWGYSTIGFFAPAGRYARSRDYGEQVREFKEMVRTLHQAGIEVILDVVYNHTAEGNHLGPTLSFKGIDNPTYYRLMPDDPRFYMRLHGHGELAEHDAPAVAEAGDGLPALLDQEMHVDGFRFDLAATLARELHEVDRLSAFFDIIHQDPVISRVKLIAEPWDVGEGGYQVGQLPGALGRVERHATATRCARTGGATRARVAELGYRLTGSSDLYESDGRRPHASINFIIAHDGFTLNDLVSYNHKHNEANGEGNRDGDNHNLSYNFGVEGPTDDPEIIRQREKQKRNLHHHPAALAGRADDLRAATRWGARSTATTTRTRRTTRSPGCTGTSRRSERELLEFTRRLTTSPARAPRLPPSALLPGAPHPRLRAGGPHLAAARRRRDDGGGVEHRTSPAASGCAWGATPCWSGTSTASG